jgi:hypothetical protein
VARSKSRKQLIRELNESRPYSLGVLEQIVFHKKPRIPERREYASFGCRFTVSNFFSREVLVLELIT